MRILLLNNFYPPHHIGGCELRAAELVDALRHRGHQVSVLTSRHLISGSAAADPPGTEEAISRLLYLESDLDYYSPGHFFLKRGKELKANLHTLQQHIEQHNPQVILVFCMWNMALALAAYAETLCPGRVVYQVSADWPYAPSVHESYWQAPVRRGFMRLPKRILSGLALTMLRRERANSSPHYKRVVAVSQAVRLNLIEKTHLPAENIRVIHNGIDSAPFLAHSRLQRSFSAGQPLTLLCAGGLAQHKGFDTAIQAYAQLLRKSDQPSLTLRIIGSGHPEYQSYLVGLAEKEGVAGQVRFEPQAPRSQMAEILGQSDIFVLPSHYEAMSRMLQEAMAAGLAVVATRSLGTNEVLVDGINGLGFEPGDVDGLAQQIQKLIDDAKLRRQLGTAAQKTILEHFTLGRMVDEFETYLQSVAQAD